MAELVVFVGLEPMALEESAAQILAGRAESRACGGLGFSVGYPAALELSGLLEPVGRIAVLGIFHRRSCFQIPGYLEFLFDC